MNSIWKINRKVLAERTGLNSTQISAILNKKTIPSARVAYLIEQATEGAIKAKDLRPDFDEIVEIIKK